MHHLKGYSISSALRRTQGGLSCPVAFIANLVWTCVCVLWCYIIGHLAYTHVYVISMSVIAIASLLPPPPTSR
jgi:hypothetical protein